MIKANVILDYFKWKNKIKNPNNYLKNKIKKISKPKKPTDFKRYPLSFFII